MRNVLVCTADRVLAKRVRFLLARDDVDVEIVDDVGRFDETRGERRFDLVVVSRELEGADAYQRLAAEAEVGAAAAPAIVLGGDRPEDGPSTVHVLSDPSDPQSIVELATRLLNGDAPFPPPAEQMEQTMKLDAMTDDRGARPDAASDGPIDPAALAKRFYACASRGLSGRLELETPEETLTFHLDEGRPVHLTSSRPGDRFGKWLVDGGRLSDVAYAKAAKHAVETGRGLGESFVETGSLSADELARHRADHTRTLIVDHFGAHDARFRFAEGGSPSERTFELDVLPVIAEGFKRHASDDHVHAIVEDRAKHYFKVRTDSDHLGDTFKLEEAEVEFLRFGGRAYNPADAAELSSLPFRDALKLLALMWTCDEIEAFTPSVTDFEARINEEKERARESRSIDLGGRPPPPPPPLDDEPAPLTFDEALDADEDVAAAFSFGDDEEAEELEPIAAVEEAAIIPAPPPPPEATPMPVPLAEAPAESAFRSSPPPPGLEIPPMPVPGLDQDGLIPAPMVWAPPGPRGPDGSLVETPERAESREHFQRGVQMLGQGHFDAAEGAFREAVATCSDEPVYLIGLARAIFYNPAYRADGKVPLLQAIVTRAQVLAPDDPRVTNLSAWVAHAQPTPVS